MTEKQLSLTTCCLRWKRNELESGSAKRSMDTQHVRHLIFWAMLLAVPSLLRRIALVFLSVRTLFVCLDTRQSRSSRGDGSGQAHPRGSLRESLAAGQRGVHSPFMPNKT